MGEALARRPDRRRLGERHDRHRRDRRRAPTRCSRSGSPECGWCPSPAWAAADADVVVIAVKPGDVAAALESLRPVLPDHALVLSIAAGVTHRRARGRAPGRPVVRAMPNTGALVGKGAAAIAAGAVGRVAPRTRRAGAGRGRDRRARARGSARRRHRTVGLRTGVRVPVRRGHDRSRRARRLAARHRGARSSARRCSVPQRCLDDGETSPEALRAAVTSPGGTTAAGLCRRSRLTAFARAILDAVEVATRRSRELGGRR